MKALVSVQTLFISLIILYYQIVPWSCSCITTSDTTNVDDRSTVREHSRSSTNIHHSQRKLLFLRKPTISIVNPKNGTVMGKTKVEIDVKYGKKTTLSLPFHKFSKIELLMDAKQIGVQMLQSTYGQVTFTVDLTNMLDGFHTLTARGVVGLRRKVIQSRSVSINVKSVVTPVPTMGPIAAPTFRPSKAPTLRPSTTPTFRPSKAPTFRPTTAPTFRPSKSPTLRPTSEPVNALCNPENSFLYFTGHDEASSMSRGQVNITWSPAIPYSMESQTFLWCGNYTYDVFVAQGGFDFLGVNKSVPDLIAFVNASGSNMVRFETRDLQMVVPGLAPGFSYSILVTAKTAAGHYSYNRNQADLNVSSTDPIVKSNFTRMIILPEPTDNFRVNCSKNESKVLFAGELPTKVLELQVLDFVYFFDSGGNATMAQLLSKPLPQPSGEALWYFKSVDLTDVFDELDMDVDVIDSKNTDNSTDDLVDEDDDPALEAEFEALDDKIKQNFCLITYPGSASGECFETDTIGRRLFHKKLWKKVKEVFKKVKEIVKKIVEIIDIPLTLSKSVTWLDINKSAKLSHPTLEIGLKFDMYAKTRFSIKISLIRLVHQASAQLTGGYGLQGYLYFSNATSRSYKPKPVKLFEVSYRYLFFIGPIPVVITNRPSLSSYIEVATAVEGKALFTASIGYDFSYELSYDRYRSNKYQKRTTITRRPNLLPDPTFNLRLNATAEVGMVLAWDFLLYEILQATTAVDVGLRSELEVGTSVEAMVITSPYFFTLQKFEVEAFIRIRLTLGINLLKDIVRQINFLGDNQISFGSSNAFRVPTIPPLTSFLPDSLEEALEKAKTHPIYGNATAIALSDLNSLVPDLYTGIKGLVQGLDRNFSFTFNIWSQDFFLLGTPRIALQAASEGAQICQGANAIVLRVVSQQTRAIIQFKNGLQQNAMWFANFDGIIFKEDTAWILNPDQTSVDSVSLRLPRSAISRPGFSFFEIQDKGSVYLRATAEIIPFPKYNMFAKASLKTLFPIPKFECCNDSDCTLRFGAQSPCLTDRFCGSKNRLAGFPATIFVSEPSLISLSVFLNNVNATNIEKFFVYRVDSVTGVVGSTPIVSLLDVGSGVGNDTVAGDLIYSNTIAIQSTFVGEAIGFQAVPVIQGIPKVNSTFTFLNLNVTVSVPGKTNGNNSLLVAGGIDNLVLKITYTWPTDKKDLDTGTEFLGGKVGFACSAGVNGFMNFTGDDTTSGGKETVHVFLGKSFLAGAWKNWTTVKVNAGWYQTPHRGPASVSLSTLQIFGNGSFVDDRNTFFFPIDPGVQSGCAAKTVATVNITSGGNVTIINVTQIK